MGVYLFEPISVLTEPFFENCAIQTIVMCHPHDSVGIIHDVVLQLASKHC